MRAKAAAAAVIALALVQPTCTPRVAQREVPHVDLEQVIRAREYRASRSGAELQAPNRAQNLRTWFGPRGIRVHDRAAPGSPKLVSMELRAIGRGELRREIGAGEVTHDGARVEIARPGLTECYENRPEGLEQGFTLEVRLAGEGDLWLELHFLGASARARGAGIELETASRRTLRYAKLGVRDATGARLDTRMALAGSERLRLCVADADAVYPMIIDPLLNNAGDAQLESNQQLARFGVSVAPAGDVNGDGYGDVIVGAPEYDAGQTDEGAAFVFLGSASGIASAGAEDAATQLESNRAIVPGAFLGPYFGSSVASAGDVNGDGYSDVIVGAVRYDAVLADEGAAFVFLGSAAGIPDGNTSTAATQLRSDQALSDFKASVPRPARHPVPGP
jgi:hypothetical protein